MSARSLPSGTVTFLFTDVEGSTRLLEQLGDAYAGVLLEHRRVLREAVAAEGGVEVDTQGDAFFVAFPRASGAAAAALAAQAALADGPVQVRMGLHTGEPLVTSEGYVGMDVHRGARIAACGHGGQVLISEQTQKLLGERGDLRDLGFHRLKDLGAAERIFQLGDGDFPAPKSLNQTNLPIQATPFLGREGVLQDVVALLRRNDVRLATLTGPGGTGKTRLGIQAAAELAEDYPDGGVWFASLAALAEPDLMLPTIAQAIGLRDAAGEGALQLLTRYIAGRATLLVVDNLEQLLPAGAPPLAALLAACPRLRMLVTSRELLRISAEHAFPVSPLARAEAVAFFTERAQAVRPDFALTDLNTGVVAAVCARLDDLPLAVELAAARVRLLSPDALLARLEQRLPLLVGGAREAPERQRTLRAAIAWSHDLLPGDEQQLFARLAVFTGGCTLQAAEEVCDAGLEALEALIDKSLVICHAAQAAEPRYGMLETIREFALEQLAARDEADTLRARHADFCNALAEQAEQGLKGPDQSQWLDRLEAEHDNLRASLEWSLHRHPDSALHLAADLWLFWYMHGHVSEGRTWLGRALAAADTTPSRVRAKALDGAGYLAGEQDEADCERLLLEESLSCARLIGSDADVATAACHLAGNFLHDDEQRALALGREAVALAREVGDRYLLAMALNNMGGVERFLGEPGAAALLEESYGLRRESGDASRIALSLANLGDLALETGDTGRARLLVGEALELAQEIGDKRHIARALMLLGWVALAEREFEEAARHLSRGLAVSRELGQLANQLEALLGIAGAAAGMDDPRRAARLAAASEANRSLVVHDPARAYYGIQVPYLEAARTQAGSVAWRAAWDEGARMRVDEAIDYALGKT
jgi:predicted ATPase/class 3 adenylate cyclase